MRIDALTISRFKGLLNLHLPCLSRITLFGGPNCVGKSTLLEAIFLFFDRYNPQMMLQQLSWRGIQSVAIEPKEVFAPFFFDFDLDREITVGIESSKHREKLVISFTQLRNGEIPAGKIAKRGEATFLLTEPSSVASFALELRYQPNRKDVEVSRLIMAQNGLVLQSEKPGVETRRANIVFAGHSGSSLDAQRFGRLDKMGQAEEAVRFMRSFFPQLGGLSVIPGVDQKPVLHADVGLARKIPVGWAGEGLSRLLSIYLAIADAHDGVVLIDEVGAGIHYSALAKVWKGVAEAAEKYRCQVFATTHSYECIEAANEGLRGLLKPDFTYVLLDKTDRGIVPKCYPYDVLDAALEAHLEIRG